MRNPNGLVTAELVKFPLENGPLTKDYALFLDAIMATFRIQDAYVLTHLFWEDLLGKLNELVLLRVSRVFSNPVFPLFKVIFTLRF